MSERVIAHPHLAFLEDMKIPDEVVQIAYKLELYLIRGRNTDLLHFWNLVERHFEDQELGLEHYEELHFRVARQMFRCMKLNYMQMVLEGVPPGHHNEQYQLLQHLLGHFRSASEYRAFFPLNVPFESRDEGPHLFEDTEDRKVTRWCAGRVDWIEDELIHTVIKHFEGSEITEARMEIPFPTLEQWGSDREYKDVGEGDYFEIAMFNGDSDNPRIKWWGREWDGWSQLPPTRIDTRRYLRYDGLVEDHETFVGLYLRGEADLSEIDDYVDQWHEGTCDWSRGWTLADHLGMLPEEYEEWVSDPDSLSDILEKRT